MLHHGMDCVLDWMLDQAMGAIDEMSREEMI